MGTLKKLSVLTIFVSVLVSPWAAADETFGGMAFGNVRIEEVDTGNLGILLGGNGNSGFGYEFLYSFTLIGEEDTVNDVKFSWSTNVLGLFATFRTPGPLYIKGKVGYGQVLINFDPVEGSGLSDAVDDISYGVAAGIKIGKGAFEATYYRFPDIEEFNGFDIDDERVEMLNISYLFTF